MNNSPQGTYEESSPIDFNIVIPDANSTQRLLESTVEINTDSLGTPIIEDGFETAPINEHSAAQGFDNRDNSSNERVAKIHIHPSRTRGENVDGKSGDDGIVVLVQPKSARGNIVLTPGELTVSLIDPSAAGEKQRIGLWKFLPQELQLFESDAQADESGYLLHLPWDRNIPQSNQLMLFVRYSSPDGKRLETSNALTIQPPSADYSPDDPIINGWTKRDPKWDLESNNPESMIVERAPESRTEERGSNAVDTARRGIPAIRASTTIDRPRWRPTR